MINDSRKNHFRRKLQDCRDDPRRRWNVVKELLHSSSSDNSRTDAENRELCQSFFHFFSSKILSLKLSITSQLSRLSPSSIFPDSPLAGSTLYSLPPVTSSEVFKILSTSPLKSSSLDFLPSSLLKSCPAVFSDLIAHLANLSFNQGHFPTLFKSASVTPLLKKPGLDKSLPSNYRPISNLNTISKILERLFLNRVQSSIVSSPNFNQFQNAYRPRHSTETCLLATLDNIFSSSDSGNSTLLVSLDLSAAFDSIDHAILLGRLKTSFGFDGLVYNWIKSYLTGRSQTVTIGNNSSASIHVASGVPQGSVLGPLLFSIYTSPIASIASTFCVSQQQFADDSQLYISLSPSNFPSQINRLEECLTALHAWCCHNSLSLNPDKSVAVLFGTRQRSHSFSDVTTVNVAGSVVPMADHVKLLGVTLDNHLSMDKHVNEVSRACFYHLRALRHIRPAITASDANMIACSVVGSRLDYANAVLYGISSKNINRLQRIQNALARCVVDPTVHGSSKALLQQLHWLPIQQRIDFKLAKLAFLACSSATSFYLNSSVARYLPSRTLRSQDTCLLAVPRTKTVFGSRAFRVAAPTVFNSLPQDIRSTDNISTFCRLLKTFYFRKAFDQH